MNRLRKFFRLPTPDRVLLVRAVTLLVVVRLGLWLFPFRTLQRLLATLINTHADFAENTEFGTVRRIWAVRAAIHYVPQATCLTQALAAQVLLGLGGIPACVRIGVAKRKEGKLEAHAWLESSGKVLLGGSDAGQYVPLLALSTWRH
jgi:hypothetical protein